MFVPSGVQYHKLDNMYIRLCFLVKGFFVEKSESFRLLCSP